MLEWARSAESGPFSQPGVLDRVVFESFDPLLALAMAAGVPRARAWRRPSPSRHCAPPPAGQSHRSLQLISGGRLVLGVAVGARRDDYLAAGVDYARRGHILVGKLARLRDLWEDGTVARHWRNSARTPE